ncbi:AzlC family ABC transporter permease [Clostridium oceanicum]|uniref:AzlC family ABC transporter permease n=1 Tax=Clostridium oceanicum TaxID=1543 RepID=A0ABP3UL61_9CLOT
MGKDYRRRLNIKDGAFAAIPLVIGYIPVAMAFGILSKNTGISLMDSFLFSVLVFAGASQFMALNLLSLGTGIGQIILTTLLVNSRHFLMSASLTTKLTKDMKKWIPFIAFGVTDESFSVASFKEEELTKEFMLSLQYITYLSWILGTVLGYILGQVLPTIIKDSMGIALYSMFISILIPEAKKSNKVLIMAVLAGIVNTLLSYLKITTDGWNLVLTIILVSILGAFTMKEKEVSICE